MAEKDFAIVCDGTCDLPLSFLEKAAVVPLRLGAVGAAGARDALERLYRDLAAQGFARVVSIHSAAAFSPVVEDAQLAAAACADVADVCVVDSGSGSVATGMLIDRAARYRHFDVDFADAVAGLEELAARVRLLVIPASSAPLAARRRRPSRAGLIGRAAASLRMRVTGERGLYLLSRGELTQLARGADCASLALRLARAASTVAGNEGELVHALAEAGDVRALRAVERALDEAAVPTSCLGTVRALPLGREVMGAGSVAVAIAPRSAYWRDEASLRGLGSQLEEPAATDAQTRRSQSAAATPTNPNRKR